MTMLRTKLMNSPLPTTRVTRITRRLSTGAALAALLAAPPLATGCDKSSSDTNRPDEDGAGSDGASNAVARIYPDPPPPTDPRPINFPELQTFELPNKLAVYVVENHEVPIVSVQLVVKAGDIHDPLLAEFTADLLSEGTTKKKKAQIDATIEQVGGSLGSWSGTHASNVSTRVLSKDLGMALNLLADVARNPRFPPDALEKIKEAKKTNVLSEKSDGGSLGRRLLGMRLYPEGHPYGRPFPTDEEIVSVTIDQVKAFHASWYAPNNAYVILSGDIDKAKAEKLVTKALGYWKPAKEFPEHPLEKYVGEDYQKALPSGFEVHIVDRPSISADILMGNLSLPRNSPDWIKMRAVTRVLGGSFGSRFFLDIREEKKLTYNIGAFMAPAKAAGAFVVATQTKKIEEMLTAVLDHLVRIRSTDPTDAEFDATMANMTQSLPLQLETTGQLAGKVRETITFGLPDDYYRTYVDNVSAIKKSDFEAVAKKYIHEVPIIVIVGKAKKIERQLEGVEALKGAKIVKYDLDLKIVK
jgi:zinc protease